MSKIYFLTKFAAAQRSHFLVLVGAVALSKFLLPSIGTTLIFFAVAYFVAELLPGSGSVSRFSAAAVLFIGLSPFYLILRGFITRSELSHLDFQIYAMTFWLVSLFFKLSRKNQQSDFLGSSLNKKVILTSMTGLAFSAIIELLLTRKSIGHAVSWIASGDSKNHLVNGVEITKYGYLDIATFFTQPVSSPTYLSMVLSQNSPVSWSNTAVLEFQMQMYAHVWVLLIGVMGLTFAATAEVFWTRFQDSSGPVPLSFVMLTSLIPTFSMILGPALFDGFFTALLGISLVVAMTSWFIEIQTLDKFSLTFQSVGLLIFVSSVLSWMFVLPATLALLLVGIRQNIKILIKSSKKINFFVVLILSFVVLVIHLSTFGQEIIYKIKYALTATGAASTTNPNVFISLLLLLLALGMAFRRNKPTLGRILILLSVSQFVALVGFKLFANLDLLGWNYYLLKYQWIMFSSIIAVALGLALYSQIRNYHENKLNFMIVNLLIFCSVFFLSEGLISVNKVWQKIWSGWENPRSAIINKLFEQDLDTRNPTMFFHYGYAGDARLGNFWSTAFINPVEPLKGWNYTIDPDGDPSQLCDVNSYYPRITVVTNDENIQSQLEILCPKEEFTIIIEPSPI